VIYAAPLLFLGPDRVIEHGALYVEGGRVVTTGREEALRARFPGAPIRRFSTYLGPEAANAHTHLDLGPGPTFKGPFMDFVLKAVFPKNAERGVGLAREAAKMTPQRALGDIAATDVKTVEWWLLEAPFSGVVYWEVLGIGDRAFEERLLAETKALIRRLKRLERPGGPRLGLSPHAPYSLTPRLMKEAVALAWEEGLPLQIHAAESPAEAMYFKERQGPIAEFHRQRGIPLDLHPVGLSPIAYLAELGVLEARPTLIHGVQVDAADLGMLADAGVRVVSCPRSNVNLEAGLPPYDLYQARGVPLALGTDSALSAESLDVWDEVRFLTRQGVPAREAIRWALAGYAVLGLEPPAIRPGTPEAELVGW